MTSSSKFVSARLLNPKNAQFNGQERVNAEIFTAMEILGRKLERTEEEKNRLEKRLALIESAATIDEKTGKVYLPALITSNVSKNAANNNSSKWMLVTSLMSTSIAVFALSVVLFREPLMSQPYLNEQVALNKTSGWKQIAQAANEKESDQAPSVPYSIKTNVSDVFKTSLKANSVNTDAAVNRKTAVEAVDENPVEFAEKEVVDNQIEQQPAKAEEKIIEVIPVVEKTAPPKDEPVVVTVKQGNISSKEPEAIVDKTAGIKTLDEAASAEKTVAAKSDIKKDEPVKAVVLKAVAETPVLPDENLPASLKQLENRAYQGVAEAQHDMGIVYAAGKRVNQDYKRAVYWLEKAANNGIANANYNLAVMYQQGLGVNKDLAKSVTWYKNAAELGHPEAMYNLGIAYIEGMGVDPQTSRSVSYFKRAAEAGVTQAAYNLGVIFESDITGEINIAKAVKWYQLAADKGNVKAAEAVARIKDFSAQTLTMAEKIEPAAGQ